MATALAQLDAVLDERNRIIESQQAVDELATVETRALTAEEAEADDRMEVDIAALNTKISRIGGRMRADAEAVEARAAHAATQIAETKTGDDDEVEATQKLELRKLTRGEVSHVDIGYKPAVETRDLTAGTPTDGAELVPTTLFNEIHRLATQESAIMSLARVIRTAGGEALTIPRVSSNSAVTLIAEAATIPESDPQFDTVSLSAYKFGRLLDVSSELEQDAAFNIDGFVTEEGGASIGRGVNTEFVAGSGTNRPQGVINAAVGITTAAIDAVTADELINAQHEVLPTQRARAVWMFNDTTIRDIRKLKDNDGNYLWQRSIVAGEQDMLLGNRIYSEPDIAAMGTGNIFGVFGDMSGFYVRFAGAVRVDKSMHAKFGNDLVSYRFLVRVDSAIVDTTGIRTLVNL